MADDTFSVVPEITDEQREALYRRYQEARRAGLSIVEANLFADSGTDVGLLRRLVAKGCPPELIREILL